MLDGETPAPHSGAGVSCYRRTRVAGERARAASTGGGPTASRGETERWGFAAALVDSPSAVDQTAAASLAAAAMIASNSAPRSAGNSAAGAARISATFSCAFSVVLLAPAFFQPS